MRGNQNLRARHLRLSEYPKPEAVQFIREWHSRLPNTQSGPWQFAFAMIDDASNVYAVALWNNPSARMLPSHWLELRRMACSADAPRNTASRFLSLMEHWFRERHPTREKLISYQDTAVHTGSIYKAAGWVAEYVSKPRVRDRSKPRAGTKRMYRTSIDGIEPDASAKVRWAKTL